MGWDGQGTRGRRVRGGSRGRVGPNGLYPGVDLGYLGTM